MRGLLGEKQRTTLFQLLDVVARICQDVQDVKSLDQLENEVNLVLAKIERDFPISVQVYVCTYYFKTLILIDRQAGRQADRKRV